MIYCKNCNAPLSSEDRSGNVMYIDNKCSCFNNLENRVNALEIQLSIARCHIETTNKIFEEQFENLMSRTVGKIL